VWCAKDRKGAITRAKLGEQIAPSPVCNSAQVVANHISWEMTLESMEPRPS